MIKELEPIANKLNESHSLVRRLFDRLTDEQAAQIKVTPDWSLKDELAHLVGAKKGMSRIAQGMAKGDNPQLPDGYNNDYYNARQVEKRKNQALADIRAELDAVHADLLAFLDTVTAQQLALRGEHPLAGEISLKELLLVIYSHETSHCNEMSTRYHEKS